MHNNIYTYAAMQKFLYCIAVEEWPEETRSKIDALVESIRSNVEQLQRELEMTYSCTLFFHTQCTDVEGFLCLLVVKAKEGEDM